MKAHKFKLGQLVQFVPGKLGLAASSREYKIVRLLPEEGGQPQYRIKGIAETFERMAKETELSLRS